VIYAKRLKRRIFDVVAQNLPMIGDKPFLMHREAIVVEVFAIFRLIKVRYAEETTEFCVDACALTTEPDYTNSISLRLLRGNCGE
jgi:hypothetical protein